MHVFHEGLTKLIGPPRMIQGPDGVPSIRYKMAKEHKEGADSSGDPNKFAPRGPRFRAPNMKENEWTTSEAEWEFVEDPNLRNLQKYNWVHGDTSHAARRLRRQPWPQEYLKQKMEEQNEKLSEGKHERLILDEAIAARLYTGPVRTVGPFSVPMLPSHSDIPTPDLCTHAGALGGVLQMYYKYNLVLRGKSDSKFMQDLKQKECQDNDYVSTIHAINSCVVKMTKLMKPCKVCSRASIRGFIHRAEPLHPDPCQYRCGAAPPTQLQLRTTTVP